MLKLKYIWIVFIDNNNIIKIQSDVMGNKIQITADSYYY